MPSIFDTLGEGFSSITSPLTRAATAPAATPIDTSQLEGAMDAVAQRQLRADAWRDVRNISLAGLGAGVAGRGVLGLLGMFKKPLAERSSLNASVMPLPYPVEDDETPDRIAAPKRAEDLVVKAGLAVSSKAGLPWYATAGMLGGLGSMALGWKLTDSVLDRVRRREREAELEKARQEFRSSLLMQYDAPLSPAGSDPARPKAAAAVTALDQIFDTIVAAISQTEKQAVDWRNMLGAGIGTYAAVGSLGALIAGGLVYEKARKRSQRAVLEKALQRRDRRRFMQSPTQIFAVPEPVSSIPRPDFRQEMALLQGD